MKIKKSLGRYVSLLIIVLVGVGFFAGLQITAPDIVNVADSYYKEQVLMDFKIVGSLGLTDADVVALKQLEGVLDVIPSYSLDVQSRGKVIRIHAIEDNVNLVKLTEGQLPWLDAQCVADSRHYSVGDIIEIAGAVDDKIKNTLFTVVGLVDSVLYLHDDYGSTNIGNGELSSFIFINKNNFILDVYTEIYLIIETYDAVAYSDEYVAYVAKLNDALVKIKPDRENARFDEIYVEAMASIEENEVELNIEKAKAEKEFSDAKKKLDDGMRELNDGKTVGLKEFEKAKATLDENAQKIRAAKIELAENEMRLNDTIRVQNAEFNLSKQLIADAWEKINVALMETGITAAEVDVKICELELVIIKLQAELDLLPVASPEYTALSEVLMKYLGMLNGLKQVKGPIDDLAEKEKQLNDGIAVFNVEIEKAMAEIDGAKNEIIANERTINNSYDDYYANIAKFNTEIANNEKKINDGYLEYSENLKKFNVKIADAVSEINDAKAELSNIKHSQWYISDRNAAIGYDELGNSIQIVAIVATIFPFFFILIAMLMTSNSMARMITEERNELGTLTSLGYKDQNIVLTYLLYVLSASGIGALLGFFIGCRIFPPLIYANFTFILPPLILKYNLLTFGLIAIVTFTLMTLVTVVTCNKELKQKPASLMRPLPPKHGQQIFFEKITFIWKRLSFTWKVTLRNMFRHKKRAFMTIVGVAGCASLLLIAFGLYDGMSGVAQKQYGDILQYDNMIILKDETQTISGELQTLLDNQQIIDPLLIRQSAYKCENNNKLLDAFLITPQNNDLFEQYFNLKSTIDRGAVVLSDGAVIITQRIAVVYNLQKGGNLTIKDADNNLYTLSISDIVENYASNYIYINAFTYEKIFNNSALFNTIVSNHNTDKINLAETLIDSGFAINVIFTNDTIEKAHNNTESLNGVIVLIVIVASILAVVVLYNLTAINISERTREIATLKVLGFRDNETNAYIYREAIILTIISIGIGVILGIILHHTVIDIIEVNALSLPRNIEWTSYTIAGTITMIFSTLMQGITYFKLKKIDMIESLKSVE
ncbi:MAG: FtsX-like permease family protein [Nitrososphaerota archaeon]|nr:FtsX-like permease family protein [Nitrososphaerota archaeon]